MLTEADTKYRCRPPRPSARNACVQELRGQARPCTPARLRRSDRAIAADPSFALAHTAKARALLGLPGGLDRARVDGGGKFLTADLSEREVRHVAFSRLDGKRRRPEALAHIAGAPYRRLATRHRRARDNRIHATRPGQQFRPRRAEAHAARGCWTGSPRAMATIGGSRRTARMAYSENARSAMLAARRSSRSPRAKPEKPLGGARLLHISPTRKEMQNAAACNFLSAWLPTYPHAMARYTVI